MKHTLRTGFTLIEIMVVISIIASLASVILVGVRAAQASGRDSARQSSALQVRNALALYATDHGGVPSGAGVAGCNAQTIGGTTSYVCKGDLESGVLKPLVDGGYISHIPVDMIYTNGLEYTYVTAPTTGVTPGANGTTVAITPTAEFNYVSEFKSADPVTDPVIVPTYIGEENTALYPNGGYPIANIVIQPGITGFTGPSTILSGVSGTWTASVRNPAGITLTYSYDWGDSTSDLLISSSTKFDAYHAYAAAGTYTIVVTLTGSNSQISASTQTVVTAPVTQLLTVSTTGLPSFPGPGAYSSLGGGGTITSSVGGINCQNSGSFGSKYPCSATISGSVTLTASTSYASLFDGWAGDCASSGTNPTCVVDMSVPRTVVAYFAPKWSIYDFSQYNSASWNYALSTCSDPNFGVSSGGTTGWHLPTRAELQTGLQDGSLVQPKMLSATQTAPYWTSEEFSGRSGFAWACSKSWSMGANGVPMLSTTSCSPQIETYDKYNLRYARCVR